MMKEIKVADKETLEEVKSMVVSLSASVNELKELINALSSKIDSK